MSSRKTKPPTYLDRLLSELDDIHTGYAEILAASGIVNIDRNRRGEGIAYLGAAKWAVDPDAAGPVDANGSCA